MRASRRNHSTAVLFFACTATAIAYAQSTRGPVEALLARVQANTDLYNRSVPSFICDEHVTSQEFHAGKLKREITEDALFRVARSANGLTESREVRAVDGKPSNGSRVKMPLTFSGGFSGALTKFLSQDHRQCFDYKLEDFSATPAATMAFTFAAKAGASNLPMCTSIQSGTTGKFVVESATMQVIHIERTTPMAVGTDQAGTGTAEVDFASVPLADRPFWLPTTITAYTFGSSKADSVRFTAHYSNYHRFAVSSTILSIANP